MPTPRLKPLFCAARGDRLVVSIDPRRRVEIDDPDGRVRDLLALLAEGTRGTGALASELGLPEHEIRAAVGDLDDLGWLEDAAARPVLDAGLRERHHSNLAFLDGFSSLDRSSASMPRGCSAPTWRSWASAGWARGSCSISPGSASVA